MSRAVRLTPEAELDLADAHGWYEEQRPGLGDEFLLCLEAAVESARRRPLAHAVVADDIRRVLARRFPYAVFFVVEDDTIVVVGVLHAARDPSAWRARR